MDDSTDPLNGDLGLGLTCSPPDQERDDEDWAPPSSPRQLPTPTLQETSRAAPLDNVTLARIHRTVVTFALVEFDIDAGPILKETYPPTTHALPSAVQQNIAFSSLPEGHALLSDTARAREGYAYSWRIPLADDGTPTSLYGYTWFVREQDSRLRRGYAQKSLVLITHLASLSGLFSALIEILGPLHFKHAAQQQQQEQRQQREKGAGEASATSMGGMVETACHNIASWPDLTPGTTLELPFLGSVLTVAIPLSPHQVQLPPSASSSSVHFNGNGRSRTRNLPYTDPPSPFLSQQAWSASSDRIGTPAAAAAAAAGKNHHSQRQRRQVRADGANHGGGGMGTRMVGMGEVEEGTIPASLPATPLCTLLFPPPPPPPPPFSSSSSSFPPQQQQQQRPSQNGTLLHPSSSPAHNSSSPSPSPSLAGSPRTLPRKSPALGSSSGGLSSPAPSATLNASSTAAAGAGAGAGAGEGIDFSTLVTLWELLLLGEPILVWSGDPRTGSEAVEGLKALIKPIPFAGDDRPYFHVHDVDFARLCKPGAKPEQGLLLASTNPLLLTTCKHWPHILRLDRAVPSLIPASPTTLSSPVLNTSSSRNGAPSSSSSSSAALRTSGSLFRSSSTHQQQQQQQQQQPQRSASTGSRFVGPARRQGSDGGGGAHIDIQVMNKSFGLKTTRKRHVKKDEAVKKEIETLWQRGDYSACDSAIYRYFASLTEQFLAPLNRYFGTLWAGNEVVARTTPLLSPGPRPAPSTRFSASAFLTSLRAHGSSLSFRSSAPSLSQPGTSPLDRFYLRFIEHSPHFQRWLEDRIVATGGEVRKRYVKQLENVDLEDWAREKQMREVDEMVGTFEREVGRLEPPENDPSASASPRTPTRNSGDTTFSRPPSSDASSDTFTATGSSSVSGPAAKLRAQATRLRLIRDEKARSLSREREVADEHDSGRLGGGLARKGSGARSIDTV